MSTIVSGLEKAIEALGEDEDREKRLGDDLERKMEKFPDEESDSEDESKIYDESDIQSAVTNEDLSHYQNGHSRNSASGTKSSATYSSTASHAPLNDDSERDHYDQKNSHSRNDDEESTDDEDDPSRQGSDEYSQSNVQNFSSFNQSNHDLENNYNMLKHRYNSCVQDLKSNEQELIHYTEKTDKVILCLKQDLELSNNKIIQLSSELQRTTRTLSEFEVTNNQLKRQVSELETKLFQSNRDSESIKEELVSSEVYIRTLTNKIEELSRSDHVSKVRKENEEFFNDLKIRHDKEIKELNTKIKELNTEIDKYEENTNNKKQLIEILKCENEKLQQSLLAMQYDKNDLHKRLEDAQSAKSDSMEGVNSLELEIRQLKFDKQNLEERNINLNNKIKSLQSELETGNALERLKYGNIDHPASAKGVNLHSELSKTYENNKLLKNENELSRKKLEDGEKKIAGLHETINTLESLLARSKEKVRDLESEIDKIRSNKVDIHSKYEEEDVSHKLKQKSHSESKLNQKCEFLENRITSLIQENDDNLQKAVEKCRSQCMDLHNQQVEKQMEKTNAELKNVCINYENKISALESDIQKLNKDLFESKQQCGSFFDENLRLQAKLNDMSVPKERQEMEKEIRGIFDKKLKKELENIERKLKKEHEIEMNAVKNACEKEKAECLLKSQEFIDDTKKKLYNEFKNCVDKERTHLLERFESAKAQLMKEYQANIDQEKKSLRSQWDQKFNTELKNKLIRLESSHHQELEAVKHDFNQQLHRMQNEMQDLQVNVGLKLQEEQEIKSLKYEFQCEKEKWETEKSNFEEKERNLADQLAKSAEQVSQLDKRNFELKRYITSRKRKHKDELEILMKQLSELQRNCDAQQKELELNKKEYDCKAELKRIKCKNLGCQTEEQLFTKQEILNTEARFFECLRNIQNEIKTYIDKIKCSYAEKLESAIQDYHTQMSKRMLEGVSKDVLSFTPTIVFPSVKSVTNSNGSSHLFNGSTHRTNPFTESCPSCSTNGHISGHGVLKTSTPYVRTTSQNGTGNEKKGEDKKWKEQLNLEDYSYEFLDISNRGSGRTSHGAVK